MGSGTPGQIVDVVVNENRVVHVGDGENWQSEMTIDGTDKVLSPGFIDVHTHDDLEVIPKPFHGM